MEISHLDRFPPLPQPIQVFGFRFDGPDAMERSGFVFNLIDAAGENHDGGSDTGVSCFRALSAADPSTVYVWVVDMGRDVAGWSETKAIAAERVEPDEETATALALRFIRQLLANFVAHGPTLEDVRSRAHYPAGAAVRPDGTAVVIAGGDD